MYYKDPVNGLHSLDSTEFEYLLPAGSVAITDSEAQALRPSVEPTYQELRAVAYPPITDYLDGIVKGDAAQVQAYIDKCLAVKAKFPKT
jgi:hypothetical protein